MIPGHIQATTVEKINQYGIFLDILEKPAKIDSPLKSEYLSISMLIKNWAVIPIIAAQIMPKQNLDTKYGHKISSPEPRPNPNKMILGPMAFFKDKASGNLFEFII
jgi:hypothetical protein